MKKWFSRVYSRVKPFSFCVICLILLIFKIYEIAMIDQITNRDYIIFNHGVFHLTRKK
jgi:hypothetical protein